MGAQSHSRDSKNCRMLQGPQKLQEPAPLTPHKEQRKAAPLSLPAAQWDTLQEKPISSHSSTCQVQTFHCLVI